MLTIAHQRHWYEPKVPHLVVIDGATTCLMRTNQLQLMLPRGRHTVRVQFGGIVPVGKRRLDLSVSSTQVVDIKADTLLTFHDRERVWNLLFDLDLAAWLVSLFVAMPTAYRIVSDTFFAVWLVRLVLIRKRYYKITVEQQ